MQRDIQACSCENDNCTFSFHVRLRLLAITLVFFYAKTSLVEKENPFNFYNDYQNQQRSNTWKFNVLRVTSTQTWKSTSMWKFSFYECLSSPYWPMREPKFYTQVQIMHRCIVFSLWAKPTNKQSSFVNRGVRIEKQFCTMLKHHKHCYRHK
jgi:hypothetical protein